MAGKAPQHPPPAVRPGVLTSKIGASVDVAPRQPPICQPVVLALEQMVQGLHGSRFAARRLVGAGRAQ